MGITIKIGMTMIRSAALILATIGQRELVEGYEGTILANGLVQTHTDVTKNANLALDIRDMVKALENNNFAKAAEIYKNGYHFKVTSQNKTETKSLAHYSLDGAAQMVDDPTFLFHVYGLSYGKADEAEASYRYADGFVNEALRDENSGTLAAEAAVALNMWMWVAHKIWDGYKDCKEGSARDLTNYDQAMAYWIGADQDLTLGSGYSLFELANQAEKDFGLRTGDEKVGKANLMLADLYETAKAYMARDNACTEGSSAREGLYRVSHLMISAMRIPLMQKLIHALMTEDKQRIKLYSLAIVPQISACKGSSHLILQDKLYTENNYDANEDRSLVFKLLQTSYDCLGFTCDDIGPYQVSMVAECADPPGDLPLVGYTPSSYVHHNAKLDLDILQIKILTELRANEAAYDIYSLGRNSLRSLNSVKFRSLQECATSKNRAKVPRFQQYKFYFEDENYADDMINMALNITDRYEELMNSEMRSVVVTNTLAYQVMYMYALEKLWWSLDACQTKSSDVRFFDQGVAYLIGSIEGPTYTFSDRGDGMLLYNLANRNGDRFGTYNSTYDVSGVVLKLMKQIEKAKAALDKYKCGRMEKHLDTIANLALVPLFQDVVKYALMNDNYPPNAKEKSLAAGEVATLSIMPIIEFYDKEGAPVPFYNMFVQKDVEPVKDGPQAVADSLYKTVKKLNISCDDLGGVDGVYICPQEFSTLPDTTTTTTAATNSGGRKVVWFASYAAVISFIVLLFTTLA